MANTLTVRAVDVGYGHIKFTDGRDAATNAIRTYSIPSQSPLFKGQLIGTSTSIMTNRDTFAVPVGDRVFEVGRDIHLALSSNQVTEVLDEGFCMSDAYAARLLTSHPGYHHGTLRFSSLAVNHPRRGCRRCRPG